MKLATIAEIIAERKGRQFDIPFKKEVEELIVIHRARLLTNSLAKNPAQKKLYSNFIIMELEKVSKDECDELEDCDCNYIKRTKLKVPQPLKIGSNPFDYVGSPGGLKPFSFTTFGAEAFFNCNKYTAKDQRYTVLNDYIYIFNDKNIEKIRVEDVFSDPRKLAGFSCSVADNVPCYTTETEFITDEALVQLIIESILSKEGRLEPQQEDIEIKADKNV